LKKLKDGDLSLVVDPALGGHIVEFNYAGVNALAESRPEIGSTFWPSPQSDWDWPPPEVLHKSRYEINETGSEIKLQSQECPRTGLQLSKRFRLSNQVLHADYSMKNISDGELKVAPWEISRTYGGITFYQSEIMPDERSSSSAMYAHGCVWHHYQPENQVDHEKIFGNGSSGWLANVHRGLMLIKCFESVSEQEVAPGEAEVEIYSHGDTQEAYIEIEQQGRYQALAPGVSSNWSVQWVLVPLPGKIQIEMGNPELLELVVNTLQNKGIK